MALKNPFNVHGKTVKLYDYDGFIKYFLGTNPIFEEEKELEKTISNNYTEKFVDVEAETNFAEQLNETLDNSSRLFEAGQIPFAGKQIIFSMLSV